MGQCKSKDLTDDDPSTPGRPLKRGASPAANDKDNRDAQFGGFSEKEEAQKQEELQQAERAKETNIDDMLAMMTVETQQKTMHSVEATRESRPVMPTTVGAQLESTVQVAQTTREELDRQNEQLKGVSTDLSRVDSGSTEPFSMRKDRRQTGWKTL